MRYSLSECLQGLRSFQKNQGTESEVKLVKADSSLWTPGMILLDRSSTAARFLDDRQQKKKGWHMARHSHAVRAREDEADSQDATEAT